MSTDAADDHRAEALARLSALERSLADLSESLRRGSSRMQAEIDGLRSSIEDAPAPEPEPAGRGVADGDSEGARLVALDLVLAGTPRDEAVLRLAADFPGVDAAALLDEAGATSGA